MILQVIALIVLFTIAVLLILDHISLSVTHAKYNKEINLNGIIILIISIICFFIIQSLK